MVPKAILVVQTNPTSPDVESQFNDWYTDVHIHDIVKIPGFGSATRYALSDQRVRDDVDPPRQRYLAIYEVETDDLEAAQKALMGGVESGDIPISEHLDMSNLSVAFYEAIPNATAVRAAS